MKNRYVEPDPEGADSTDPAFWGNVAATDDTEETCPITRFYVGERLANEFAEMSAAILDLHQKAKGKRKKKGV